MINKLKINNFKSIKNIELEFDNFNILCGENASGKTAIIHSILAVVQEYKDFSIGLEGELIKIGKYEEIHNFAISDKIDIRIEDKLGFNKVFNMDAESKVNIFSINGKELNIDFEKDIFYLSSNRIGVVDTYAKGNTIFGTSGLSSVDFIFKRAKDTMPQKYIDEFKKIYDPSTSNTLAGHLTFWHKFVTGETIDIPTSIDYTNQYVLTFNHGDKSDIRSINTGSGFSYLFPIISLCLGALVISITSKTSNIPTIIIENPEIYLHPKAQDKLIVFLLFVSKFAQIIVETHSDHVLKAAIQKEPNSKIFVFTFDDRKEETIKTEMTPQNFKTNPISYSEVQYKAFGLITPELHIVLYSQLHNKFCNGKKIKDFDDYMLQNMSVPQKKDNYNGTQYNTLPTYIRNYIDHPENTTRPIFTPEELKQSIDFMLSQL